MEERLALRVAPPRSGVAERRRIASASAALFAQIIRRVYATRQEAVFAVLGASGDLALQEELARLLPPDFPLLGLAGKTSLAGMMEVLRSSRLVLSNDSGPVHAAAALYLAFAVALAVAAGSFVCSAALAEVILHLEGIF